MRSYAEIVWYTGSTISGHRSFRTSRIHRSYLERVADIGCHRRKLSVTSCQRFYKPHTFHREGRIADSLPAGSADLFTAPHFTTRNGGFKVGGAPWSRRLPFTITKAGEPLNLWRVPLTPTLSRRERGLPFPARLHTIAVILRFLRKGP